MKKCPDWGIFLSLEIVFCRNIYAKALDFLHKNVIFVETFEQNRTRTT